MRVAGLGVGSPAAALWRLSTEEVKFDLEEVAVVGVGGSVISKLRRPAPKVAACLELALALAGALGCRLPTIPAPEPESGEGDAGGEYSCGDAVSGSGCAVADSLVLPFPFEVEGKVDPEDTKLVLLDVALGKRPAKNPTTASIPSLTTLSLLSSPAPALLLPEESPSAPPLPPSVRSVSGVKILVSL